MTGMTAFDTLHPRDSASKQFVEKSNSAPEVTLGPDARLVNAAAERLGQISDVRAHPLIDAAVMCSDRTGLTWVATPYVQLDQAIRGQLNSGDLRKQLHRETLSRATSVPESVLQVLIDHEDGDELLLETLESTCGLDAYAIGATGNTEAIKAAFSASYVDITGPRADESVILINV